MLSSIFCCCCCCSLYFHELRNVRTRTTSVCKCVFFSFVSITKQSSPLCGARQTITRTRLEFCRPAARPLPATSNCCQSRELTSLIDVPQCASLSGPEVAAAIRSPATRRQRHAASSLAFKFNCLSLVNQSMGESNHTSRCVSHRLA